MRATKVTTIVVGTAATCSGLIWTAASLTGSADTDSKPPVACSYTPSDGAKSVVIPAYDASAAARPYTAKLVTNKGTITIEALTDKAPCTTNSFSFLARKGFYVGSKCHRLTTQQIFVLECGDPKGARKGDPGYFFADENLTGAVYPAGTVAMSKVIPGKNGSRFFISYADPQLRMPSAWTPFGRVVSGLSVLKEIAKGGTQNGLSDGRPKKDLVIKSVTVQQAANR
ncbi:peptidylprolyl isomerase [Streptomyces mirabilis]|uniref:peptidylprolyl isomerase n=1 Tax=Streptomyces mirabilis TaxID=68239 RepID=UPI0036D8788A